ncbi:hypothetical protein D9M69_506510 [compost metagenome]
MPIPANRISNALRPTFNADPTAESGAVIFKRELREKSSVSTPITAVIALRRSKLDVSNSDIPASFTVALSTCARLTVSASISALI